MKINDTKIILLSIFLAILFSVLLSKTEFFERGQFLINDSIQQMWGKPADYSDILIIDIDEISMRALQSQLGSWPYDRFVYASIVKFLQNAGASQLIFDILYSEPRDGDDAFVEQLEDVDQVYLAAILLHEYRFENERQKILLGEKALNVTNPPELPIKGALFPGNKLLAAANTGLISITPGIDATVREVPLLFNIDNDYLPAMSVSALSQQSNETMSFNWETQSVNFAGHTWPVNDNGTVTLKFPSNINDIPKVPFYKVLVSAFGDTKNGIPIEAFAGKTVFIGSSAAILGDFIFIPNQGRIEGINVLALIYHSLKNDNLLHSHDVPSNILVILPWLLILGGLMIVRGIHPESLYSGYIIATLIASAIIIIMYRYYSIQAWFLMPALIGFLYVIITTLVKAIHLQFERQKLYFEKLAAEEANELKARFLAHMTHELRTPLTAIMGYNKIMIEEDTPQETAKKYLSIIDNNSEHLLNLINNILDQSKIDAEQLELLMSDSSIYDLVEQTVQLLQPIAGKKDLHLYSNISKDVPEILVFDRIRLKQIILNLIGNALKFTKQGHIEVKTEWQDNRLKIAVQDTGPGIAQDDLERIFHSFQQTDTVIASEISGTGLGLTISRNLASLMGGGITVSSELNQGSCFTLDIFAEAGQQPANPLTNSEPQNAVSTAAIHRILLAEDNPDSRNLITLFLIKGGFTIISAEDGQQALDKLSEAPDLVLLDMNMPIMNGDEVARKMREQGYKAPILALTASSDKQNLDIMMNAGCVGHIPKPVDSLTLIQSIESFNYPGKIS